MSGSTPRPPCWGTNDVASPRGVVLMVSSSSQGHQGSLRELQRMNRILKKVEGQSGRRVQQGQRPSVPHRCTVGGGEWGGAREETSVASLGSPKVQGTVWTVLWSDEHTEPSWVHLTKLWRTQTHDHPLPQQCPRRSPPHSFSSPPFQNEKEQKKKTKKNTILVHASSPT